MKEYTNDKEALKRIIEIVTNINDEPYTGHDDKIFAIAVVCDSFISSIKE